VRKCPNLDHRFNYVLFTYIREADYVLVTGAGPEIAVASTKAYTSQLVAFYLVAMHFGAVRGTLAASDAATLAASLQELPTLAEQILAQTTELQELAETFTSHNDLFFIGRGVDFAVAQEGSLKLKEISYIHSEAYAAGELKHGTLALIEDGTPVIALVTQESLYEKTLSNIKEVKARGANVLAIGPVHMKEELEKSVDRVFTIPATDALLTPALSVLPLQLLSYYVALSLGRDVDKPRNLAKSVTVE